MTTATITELPITEEDVNVIEERKSVELPGSKFYELLEYITQLDDELSISKFDLDGERRFANVLIYAFTRTIDSISVASPDMDMKEFALELFKACEEQLVNQQREGYLSAEQLQRFHRRFKRAEDSTNIMYRVR